ncbi:uncharacterized protein LDX57_000275 [Aspergillus melleus]|uniref:uncharacterized protein n=1 Tax=Aspergillus melleus TaxID=138277 RepID=UPI001E8DFB47|nr:uncharacterized protein LDX57_000275 [Aspergillus melleus]KAH8422521.1 hypothetical protein LDX57_000275 [Aspergillus melleus]
MPSQHIQRVPSRAPCDNFINALKKGGCVIVQDFTTLEALEQAQQEPDPWLSEKNKASDIGALKGGTRTCTRLLGRSQTVREKFFSDPLYQDMAEEFLAIETTNWYNDEPHPPSPFYLNHNGYSARAKAQKLHRDDKNIMLETCCSVFLCQAATRRGRSAPRVSFRGAISGATRSLTLVRISIRESLARS